MNKTPKATKKPAGKGLQNFTLSTPGYFGSRKLQPLKPYDLLPPEKWNPGMPAPTPLQEQIIGGIVYGDKMTLEEYKELRGLGKDTFIRCLSIGINSLADTARDAFLEKMEAIVASDTLHQVWEANHMRILAAIDSLTKTCSRFPSRLEICRETGLSRPTVNKHLKEYLNSPRFQQKQDELLVMRETVLSRVYSLASNGDMKAARLFLETTNSVAQQTAPPPIRNQQNNFIQINGQSLSAEQVAALPEPMQCQLMEILQQIPSNHH